MDGQEFSSDDREANRDYADNVTVSVRIGDMPVDEYVTEVLEVVAPGAAWPRKWLVDQVEDLPAEAVKPGDPPGPYSIDVIERRHEWGASAASFEILLYLASAMSGGIVGNAAYDAVKVVVKKMTQRLAIMDLLSRSPRPKLVSEQKPSSTRAFESQLKACSSELLRSGLLSTPLSPTGASTVGTTRVK